MINERERRLVTSSVQVRKKGEQLSEIEGHGALFNVETVIGDYFREVILPGAFSDTVATDDIRVLFNHSPDYVLGRQSAGTADVVEDRTGLRYSALLNPDDPDAMAVGAKIKRRDVTGSSFSFTVENDDDEEWVRDDPAKLPLRRIKRAKVYDVGPVTFPAYDATTVSARCRDKAETAAATEAATGEDIATVGLAARTAAREAIDQAKQWQPAP